MIISFFRKHEWEKHGTCSEKDIIQYFNETINLHDVFDIFRLNFIIINLKKFKLLYLIIYYITYQNSQINYNL